MKTIKELRLFAAQIRKAELTCMNSFHGGHIGGLMSTTDCLACLYGGVMKHDPKHPKWDERDEGEVWEAALFAGAKKLSNLIGFVDANKKQLDGFTSEICDLGDIRQKFEDFGWFAQEVDGHDILAILAAIEKAKAEHAKPDKNLRISFFLFYAGISAPLRRIFWHRRITINHSFYRRFPVCR